MSSVELENVEKHYRMGNTTVKALRGSSLDIEKGEFVAIMGPSGSGKSTLMNMIGALDVPTVGTVKVGGKDVSRYSEDQLAVLRSKEVGFVFQQFNLISSMKAWENVALPMMFRDVPKRERKKRSVELLEKVGLGDRVDFRPTELSGGQRQRVSVARALANDPNIVLADEPTGNLDTETGEKIMKMLEELNDEGKTVIMVTHDPNDADYADRTIRIVDGVTHPGEEDEKE